MTDTIIIGAGPTGLMAALLLQQCGISVTIFDKTEQQAHESRAFAIQARSMELLLNIGIVDKFLQRGIITPGMQMYLSGRKAAELNLTDIGTDESPYPFLLMLPQAETEEIFAAELKQRGIIIERNMEVIMIAQNEKNVSVTVKDLKTNNIATLTAQYLIGADGAHSMVRKSLGLPFEGDAYPQSFMLADCSIEWPLEYAHAKVFMHKTSLGVYLPIRGKNFGRLIVVNPEKKKDKSLEADTATTAEPLELAEIQQRFQQATTFPVTLSNAAWVTRYRIHHRAVNRYSEGRIFLAGDAAHIHSPIGGQGMNTGLQDAANLAWKLAICIKNPAKKDLLTTYHDERWPVGQKLLNFTDKLFSKISSQNAITAAIRNFIAPVFMRALTHIKRCRYRAFRFISQLGIHYHQNAFLLDDVTTQHFPAHLKPGYRAPNGMYKHNHDVFDLITGYQFHVLALSKKALTVNEINRIAAELTTLSTTSGLPLKTHFIAHAVTGEHPSLLQAETNDVFDKYGLSNAQPFGLFLIRPDGYIAYRADHLQTKILREFCRKF